MRADYQNNENSEKRAAFDMLPTAVHFPPALGKRTIVRTIN